MYNMIYLDIELQDCRQSTRIVLEYLQNTAKSCVRRAIAIETIIYDRASATCVCLCVWVCVCVWIHIL